MTTKPEQTETNASRTDLRVCVQPQREKSGATKDVNTKSQDGGVCVHSYTPDCRNLALTTTTVTLYFASRSVSRPNKSTSTLLVQRGGQNE